MRRLLLLMALPRLPPLPMALPRPRLLLPTLRLPPLRRSSKPLMESFRGE
jgi:hypothetical protein